MISTRLGAAIAAGALAIGILAGSAGTIVIREAAAPSTDLSAHMSQMGSMMAMLAGQSGMMAGGSSSGSGMMGPAASAMPEWMQQHHGVASPDPSR